MSERKIYRRFMGTDTLCPLDKKKLGVTVCMLFLVVLVAVVGGCKPSLGNKRPVYIADRQALIDGSVFYNDAGCASCHGVQFDGKGPEAREVNKQSGITPTNFKAKLIAKRTPIDYFRAITIGTKSYKQHSYQNYTDRGRWSMAHYLYSLAQPLTKAKELSERRQALTRMQEKLSEIYANKRRWDIGYTPREKRSSSPMLDELLAKGRRK